MQMTQLLEDDNVVVRRAAMGTVEGCLAILPEEACLNFPAAVLSSLLKGAAEAPEELALHIDLARLLDKVAQVMRLSPASPHPASVELTVYSAVVI